MDSKGGEPRPSSVPDGSGEGAGAVHDARVTIVVATRDRCAELMRTLDKLEQLHPRSPIVVVDNASSDETVSSVQRLFPAVDVVALEYNQGAAARNVGVLRAATPYIAFNDDDSWWAEGALRRAEDLLDHHPDLGALVGRTLVGPQQRPDPVNALLAGSPLPAAVTLPGPRVLGFLACAVVVRKDAFLAIGGFSPLLFFVGEEKLLAYDLTAARRPPAYAEDLVVHHHPSQTRGGTHREALERRNEVLIAWMRRPITTALRGTAALLAGAPGDTSARAALGGVALHLPAALRQRRLLPPDVETDVRRIDETAAPGEPVPPAPGTSPSRHESPRQWAATRPGNGRAPELEHRSGPHPGDATSTARDHRISVVLITRDRRGELLRTLRQMSALPERPPMLVVDNGSTDATSEAVAEQYPHVTLLRSEHNLGSVGRNLAVRHVRTPYVAFCDDDAWWEPGALSRAADLLDAHAGLACVVARILVEPSRTEDPITPELRHSPVPGPSWLPGPALLGIMAGASVLRTSAFRSTGGFSSRLWLGGEEELLAIDLAAQGWWMCWREDVVVHHAASTVRDPRGRRQLGIRNTLWTTWLRRPAGSALRRTLSLLRSLPADRASAAAVAEAVAGLPWVIRGRRVVPPHVERGLILLEAPQRNSPARRYVDSAPGR